jgi:hypothetical protein
MDNNVKVWNRNSHDHVDKFKGSEIKIPAGKFIEMDYDEAILFKGKFYQPEIMKNGMQDPRSFKWVELDPEDVARVKNNRARMMSDDSETEKVFVCQACSKEFRTKNGLLKHIKDKHQTTMVDKEAKDELLDNEDLE